MANLHLKSSSEFAEFGISSVTNVKTKTCRKVFYASLLYKECHNLLEQDSKMNFKCSSNVRRLGTLNYPHKQTYL